MTCRWTLLAASLLCCASPAGPPTNPRAELKVAMTSGAKIAFEVRTTLVRDDGQEKSKEREFSTRRELTLFALATDDTGPMRVQLKTGRVRGKFWYGNPVEFDSAMPGSAPTDWDFASPEFEGAVIMMNVASWMLEAETVSTARMTERAELLNLHGATEAMATRVATLRKRAPDAAGFAFDEFEKCRSEAHFRAVDRTLFPRLPDGAVRVGDTLKEPISFHVCSQGDGDCVELAVIPKVVAIDERSVTFEVAKTTPPPLDPDDADPDFATEPKVISDSLTGRYVISRADGLPLELQLVVGRDSIEHGFAGMARAKWKMTLGLTRRS